MGAIPKANEAIYTGQRSAVWHRNGKFTGDQEISIPDLRAVVGIPVSKYSTRIILPTADGDTFDGPVSKTSFVTYRDDTKQELAQVGSDYTVVPHDVALVQVIEPIVESGLATIDTAGLLFNGLMGWSLLRWQLDKMDPVVREVYRDELQVFGLCTAWHAKRRNWYANVTERAVCENTVEIALAEGTLKTSVTHRRNAVARSFAAAQETFQHVVRHHVKMAEKYRALQSRYLTREEFVQNVLDVVAPRPTKEENNGKRAHIVLERIDEKRKRIFELWSEGDGHTGDGSAWEAYNGVVQSLDHDDLWKTRTAENRIVSLTTGPLAKIRASVFNSLLSLTA